MVQYGAALVEQPAPLSTMAMSLAAAQLPSSWHTPVMHSELLRHLRQVVPSQNGFVASLQSAEARHSTQVVVGELQCGVAALCAAHCASSPLFVQGRHIPASQMGLASLQSFEVPQGKVGVRSAGTKP